MEKFNSTRSQHQGPNGSTLGSSSSELLDSKKKVAIKIASSLPTSGSSAKIVLAFIQVGDFEGLDKYLSKNEVKKDILNIAIQKACSMSNAEAVRILAQHGADVKVEDQCGTTLLFYAMQAGGDPSVITTLVKYNARYEDYYRDGLYLIHWACQRDHLDLVKLLIAKDLSHLDQADESGRLPIHIAASNGRPAVLKYLIDEAAKQLNPRHVAPAYRNALVDSNSGSQTSDLSISSGDLQKMRVFAAANYLDMQVGLKPFVTSTFI
ncbi:Ankyrin-2 [Cichlidogyrus casuarinus]|uniref:Ankyrin-2 n=1 Tax=Cichlidogyrus casuarinus TaxID=1844966 RepID=A0ABD2Q1U0_9PLAT